MQNSPMPEEEIKTARDVIVTISNEYRRNIIGQEDLLVRLLLALFSGGHILLEGVPGLAKTRSISLLSKIIHASFKRIQFTPDLLPSDIVGNQIFNPKEGSYFTKTGPIFANLVLADEINRAPAKVQSALLEAMQEKQVTIGNETFELPKPFLVLATQNPIEQEGTYPLPEAQVDRFLMKTVISYPSKAEEVAIMNLIEHEQDIVIEKTVSLEDIQMVQTLAEKIYIDNTLKEYISSIIIATRYPEQFGLDNLKNTISFGASPRGSLAFMKLAKISALLQGRSNVIPEDIKNLRYDVLRHRIVLTYEAEAEGITREQVIDTIFNTVKVP